MHTAKRVSLLTICISFLLVLGACSGGGSPVTADPVSDLDKYSSSIEGNVYKDGIPVETGMVFVYDLASMKLYSEKDIGPGGRYIIGVDEGQYLVFPVTPTGWRPPVMDPSFSSYVNIGPKATYRMDIELTMNILPGTELAFGFVTSSANQKPVVGAAVSAGGVKTQTDGYGFYAMVVPSGTGEFTVYAEGFNELHKNTHEAQAVDNYFSTPFFVLNPSSQTGSSIGGMVRDITDGTGLGGVRITLERPADVNWVPIQYLTNLGGEYRFFNLPHGIYKLLFERPGYIEGTREGLIIKDQDDAILNVYMNPSTEGLATISGTVRNDLNGFPQTGARVTASNPLIGNYIATTDFFGQYLFENVVPGNYTLTVSLPGSGGTSYFEGASTFQTIVAGENTIDFNLRFLKEGVLSGTARIDGDKAQGVEVSAEKLGGEMSGVKWLTTSDSRGIFAFNALPPGTYIVQGYLQFATTETYYGIVYDAEVVSGTTADIDLDMTLQ
ncbi:MAG: carboxypeptidase-like regulatory domain-containing protein [bacterium]